MTSAIQYKAGTVQAVISKDKITSTKLTAAHYKPQLKQTVEWMNKAFRIYYEGMEIAGEFKNDAVVDQIRKDLRQVAASGWGTGVNDLNEAFEHLQANRGCWTDNNIERYSSRGTAQTSAAIPLPTAIANFHRAVNAKMDKLKELMKEFATQANVVEKTANEKNWQALKTAVSRANTVKTRVEQGLWLCSVSEESWLSKNSSKFGTLMGHVSKSTGAIKSFMDVRRAGGTELQGLAMAAMQAICEAVPIFGDLYSSAIGGVPAIAGFFRNHAERVMRLTGRSLYHFPQ